MTGEKLIIEYVYDLVDKHWDLIDRDFWGIDKSKPEFLKEVKLNIQTAVWVLTEIGFIESIESPISILHILQPESKSCEFMIIKIKDKYIKLGYVEDDEYTISFCERKSKTIYYFE